MGVCPVAVASVSDIVPVVLNKEFLDIQLVAECGF